MSASKIIKGSALKCSVRRRRRGAVPFRRASAARLALPIPAGRHITLSCTHARGAAHTANISRQRDARSHVHDALQYRTCGISYCVASAETTFGRPMALVEGIVSTLNSGIIVAGPAD